MRPDFEGIPVHIDEMIPKGEVWFIRSVRPRLIAREGPKESGGAVGHRKAPNRS